MNCYSAGSANPNTNMWIIKLCKFGLGLFFIVWARINITVVDDILNNNALSTLKELFGEGKLRSTKFFLGLCGRTELVGEKLSHQSHLALS